jgi:hypothetical protein
VSGTNIENCCNTIASRVDGLQSEWSNSSRDPNTVTLPMLADTMMMPLGSITFNEVGHDLHSMIRVYLRKTGTFKRTLQRYHMYSGTTDMYESYWVTVMTNRVVQILKEYKDHTVAQVCQLCFLPQKQMMKDIVPNMNRYVPAMLISMGLLPMKTTFKTACHMACGSSSNGTNVCGAMLDALVHLISNPNASFGTSLYRAASFKEGGRSDKLKHKIGCMLEGSIIDAIGDMRCRLSSIGTCQGHG